jgi:hypothetical protein
MKLETVSAFERRIVSPIFSMVLLIVLSVVFGYIFFRQPLESDALGYYQMSLELLRWDSTSFFWPLGWPAIMAVAQLIFGESQWVVKALSFVMVLSTLWIQLLIVRRGLPEGSEPWRYRLGYSVIVINASALLYHASFTFTNVPIAFLGSLLVYTLIFTRSHITSAVLIALLGTVRFGSIFILPFVLAYKWVRGDSLKPLFAMSVVVAVLISIPIALASLTLGRLVFVSTNNSETVFYGNHESAPLYATWRWGSSGGDKDPEKQLAIEQLKRDYRLRSDVDSDMHLQRPLGVFFTPGAQATNDLLEIDQAMFKEAVKQIIDRPEMFFLRVLARFSVLLAFDSSIGSEAIVLKGNKILGFILLATILVVSLATKGAAIVGFFGTKWPGRHLIWAILVPLATPHLLALAHPSYMQMFMNVAIPVVALSAAQVNGKLLIKSLKPVITMGVVVLLCHVIFILYMASTRVHLIS